MKSSQPALRPKRLRRGSPRAKVFRELLRDGWFLVRQRGARLTMQRRAFDGGWLYRDEGVIAPDGNFHQKL